MRLDGMKRLKRRKKNEIKNIFYPKAIRRKFTVRKKNDNTVFLPNVCFTTI
jgi:hypothetical protein